ncbi:MAG: glycoside hydrolase family 3 C-terminal domain-containing protein [Ignavibacteriales bacterium]|nr:glycoside hydrolase family 3 C-terminal domain-containing protein [Ignavibacteriales bacterium]
MIVLLFMFASLFAQQKNDFPFHDTKLSIEKRAADLVSRMTLKEKISQMSYDAPAIDRLGIPKYNWWNECLHGVARNGLATVFPQAIGLAAMWDKIFMYKVAGAISDEARAKYNYAVQHGERGLYQGLTFWSPNINIFRDPRWGRGMETYGEDPYLTGQMAVQFIKGLQGNDPKYLKVVATAKHFAVHSGPEPDRHSIDVNPSEYDLRETYLPAFKMSVQDGHVQSLMCAYNSLRGKACCSNDPLLEKILREEWGFKGYVVSDCWAISDIYEFHKQTKDVTEASAVSVKAGTDLECGNSYPALNDAIQKGLIKEEEINLSLKRLMEARLRLGMFDPPSMVPYSKLKMDVVDSKNNQLLADDAAKKSIVLLKNENNLLPLKKNIRTIAVIGPNANDEEILLGNYNGMPSNPITPLNGIIQKVGKNSKIIFERGYNIANGIPYLEIIPTDFLFTSPDKKQNGLIGEYFDNPEWKGKPAKIRVDKTIDFKWLQSSKDNFYRGNKSVRWTGFIAPKKSGTYQIGGYGFNGFNIYLDDTLLVKYNGEHHPNKIYKDVKLDSGKLYKIKIEFFAHTRYAQMQFIWSVPDDNAEARAIEAVKKSDLAVMFLGLSPRLEGEELNIDVKGFKGGDRTSLDLPETQEKLLEKVYKLGKPVVLVLINGSALSINWADKNIPAIVEAWYGGQAAGSAIADVLFGDYNPAGRLPVTFYKSVDQLPDFKDYNMSSRNHTYVSGDNAISVLGKSHGRTYRYFDGEVLYPFGYGLSYTTFEYSNLRLSKDKICVGDSVNLFIEVRNTGKVSGEEVVQLYNYGNIFNSFGAIKSLKGFERISLKPNQTKTVEFKINSQTLEQFREKGFVVDKGEYHLSVGSSSRTSDCKEIKLIIE